MAGGKNGGLRCESCANCQYDDEFGGYVCLVNLDEDEFYRLFSESSCPYYRLNDEYAIVRKQN